MYSDDDLISSIRDKKKAPTEPTEVPVEDLGFEEGPSEPAPEPTEADRLKARIKAILGEV